MAMVPEEGNSNTACFLFPPFQGNIKPPAMRVDVDYSAQAAFKANPLMSAKNSDLPGQ
jgi:hypothetical protein